MQFKHPEILYALFLLIIPIIIHLFNLQRYQKVAFTNVQFLKNIKEQTHKSEQLKKWLLLLTRLLIFTSLILAFAQPFITKNTKNKKVETNIYVDNSLSMQAKGEQGELLKNNIQKIIDATKFSNQKYSLFTNTKSYKNLTTKNLKYTLLNLNYSPNKLFLSALLLKLNSQNNNNSNTLYKNILMSDFQSVNIKNKLNFTNVNSANILIKSTPKSNLNFYIDSVFIAEKTIDETLLKVVLKCTQTTSKKIPVSLFNDTVLIGKATCKFENSTTNSVTFSIPNSDQFLGKVLINSNDLLFDNTFYFTILKSKKINVLSIGLDTSFLAKIYTKNEFNYTNSSLKNLNYNQLQNQHVVILNELNKISSILISFLNDFVKKGGVLIIIPSPKISFTSYNKLFSILKIGKIQEKLNQENLITTINYNHPLFKRVFEKKIKNFQYPSTKTSYIINSSNSSSILKFDSNRPFVSSTKIDNSKGYWFTSPLQLKYCNFIESSLVVPVFYNMATQHHSYQKIYHTIESENTIYLNFRLPKDEVLSIQKDEQNFIPLQSISQNKVQLNFQNQVFESGFYKVLSKNKVVSTIAFNYNREESNLNYLNLEETFKNKKNIIIANSIPQVFRKIIATQKINELFKWFLTLAVLFLLLEILILKYFKL